MHLDSDDLLARIRAEFPQEFDRARLGLLVDRQAEEINRLTAELEHLRDNAALPGGIARPFVGQYPALDQEAGRG